MTPVPAWRRYLRFWRPNIAEDVDAELRFHMEMRVREYMTRGMSEVDARQAVRDRLGDVDAARDECIELGKVREIHARNADFLDGLRADLRYALRSLGRAPGWTAVALLTIALGVGATTAVFRVADSLLVRPMRYRDASRVFVFRRLFDLGNRQATAPFAPVVVRAIREQARSVEAVAPLRAQSGELSADGIKVHRRSGDEHECLEAMATRWDGRVGDGGHHRSPGGGAGEEPQSSGCQPLLHPRDRGFATSRERRSCGRAITGNDAGGGASGTHAGAHHATGRPV